MKSEFSTNKIFLRWTQLERFIMTTTISITFFFISHSQKVNFLTNKTVWNWHNYTDLHWVYRFIFIFFSFSWLFQSFFIFKNMHFVKIILSRLHAKKRIYNQWNTAEMGIIIKNINFQHKFTWLYSFPIRFL